MENRRSKQDNGITERNRNGNFMPTHSLSKHPLHSVWTNMVRRCYDPKSISYKYYGEKGIKVCKEWYENFKLFYDWAISNGWEASKQIDRFPDKKGNYCPENCRITTSKENQRNRTSNNILTIDGISNPIIVWAELSGIKPDTISKRFHAGWSHKDCVYKPLRSNLSQKTGNDNTSIAV